MKIKIVEIQKCSTCPHVTFFKTTDSNYLRIYVGCGLIKRAFDWNQGICDPVPIPEWCPLPDVK